MGLGEWIGRLFGGKSQDRGGSVAPGRLVLVELSARLGVSVAELQAARVEYAQFTVPKRRGGQRKISAPSDGLKTLQRRILYRLLGRLKSHPTVQGFERGRSIVTNAVPHVGRAVVLRMDIRDFFPTTTAKRVEMYFRRTGWDAESAALLTRLCTHEGGLPQGAPTSPRLSNLVNHPMDARLEALAATAGATYTRYADDLTFSLPQDTPGTTARLIGSTKAILRSYGYRLHQDKKLRIWRRHDRQMVTGLVVNERANLPRRLRRKLRAIEHHLLTGRPATLTADQLNGWKALQNMVDAQALPPAQE
ncbi:MAG TPA: hypothetical protein DCX07_02280 [Phycisphaerales bacterium]|nr:hypothetical protein [Phycisphaerales bacterium]